jgi:hypothetical protein
MSSAKRHLVEWINDRNRKIEEGRALLIGAKSALTYLMGMKGAEAAKARSDLEVWIPKMDRLLEQDLQH